MPRRQVQDPLAGRASGLRPQAQQLDTFVQPQNPGVSQTNPLMELAGALDDIQPSLKQYGAVVEKATVEREVRQAQADRLANQKSFADAVSSGLIPEGANPHYVREYKRMDGELSASGRYLGFLSEKWQTSGLADADFATEADAAQAFEGFVSGTRTEFLTSVFGDGEIDPDWVAGFEQRRGGIEGAVANRQVTERIANNEEKFEARTSAKIGEMLAGGLEGEDLSTRLNQLATHQRQNFGVGYEKFNELVVEQVVSTAMSEAIDGNYFEAREALDRLSEIKTGTGPLSNTGKAKEAINAARTSITRMEQQQTSYQWSRTQEGWARADRPAVLAAQQFQRETRAFRREEMAEARANRHRKDTRELTVADVMMEIVADPTQDFDPTWAQLAQDPNTANLVPVLQNALSTRINAQTRVVEDPDFVTGLKVSVLRGTSGPEEVLGAVADKQITYQNARDILEDWDRRVRTERQYANQSGRVRTIIANDRSNIGRAVAGSDYDSSPAQYLLAGQAQDEYDVLMLEFLEQNPSPSPAQVKRASVDAKKLLLNDPDYRIDNIADPDDVQYKTPEEVGRDSTQSFNPPVEEANPFDEEDMVE